MYAADFLIERLQEQVKLAPSLTENTAPGGSLADVVERLTEGMNQAKHIGALAAVESGPRRYSKAFAAALAHVEKLKPIFAQCEAVAGAAYADGAQREKAFARFKDTPKQIEQHCKAAIAELEGAIKILEEGERKEARQGVLAGAK